MNGTLTTLGTGLAFWARPVLRPSARRRRPGQRAERLVAAPRRVLNERRAPASGRVGGGGGRRAPDRRRGSSPSSTGAPPGTPVLVKLPGYEKKTVTPTRDDAEVVLAPQPSRPRTSPTTA
jgi:hypothetical protein